MRKPLKPMFLCLFSLLCLSPVLAADLKTYSEVYQKNSEEIRQSFQPKFDDLQKQYQKSLVTLKTLAKNQGDLTKTLAAIAEIERFQKAKSLPAAPDDTAIPEIKAFQTASRKIWSRPKSCPRPSRFSKRRKRRKPRSRATPTQW